MENNTKDVNYMWFIATDTDGCQRWINTQYITCIFFDGSHTRIVLMDTSTIYLNGDHTSKISEILRFTGIGVKKINE